MKHYILLTKSILVLLLISLYVTAIPGTVIKAEDNIVYSEPVSGPVGTTVSLEGIYFTPSVLSGITSNLTRVSRASIYFPDKNTLCQTAVIDTWGKLSASIVIGEYPAGKYEIWIHDETAGPLAWVSVPFTIRPQINLSKRSGYIGDTITISGTGFKDSSYTIIYYGGKKVSTLSTNEKGSFNKVQMTIPDCSNNEYEIIVVDGRGNEAVSSFTSQHQKLVIFPNSGSTGDEINVIGTGFEPQENISFKLYNTSTIVQDIKTNPNNITSDIFGNFDAYLSIPACTSNYYVLEAFDGSSRACATLTVSSSGFFDRDIGFIGSNVTFAGNGFIPYKYTVAYFDDLPLIESKADMHGVSTLHFIVPLCMPGEHVVCVTDGINSYSYPFTVISKAVLEKNRTSGTVGSEIILTGTGFVSEKVAAVTFNGNEITETQINESGELSLSFAIPVCEPGVHTIQVSDGINDISTTVKVEYLKIPQLVPVTPDKLGISGSEVTLSWEGIRGFDGLSYSLQIAKDSSFEPSSTIIQEQGIPATYFLFKSDSSLLSDIVMTSFFWRIRAESSETVPGEWSVTREFLMILPVVEVETSDTEKNPIMTYGLFIEMGALSLLLLFWLLKRRTKSAKIHAGAGS